LLCSGKLGWVEVEFLTCGGRGVLMLAASYARERGLVVTARVADFVRFLVNEADAAGPWRQPTDEIDEGLQPKPLPEGRDVPPRRVPQLQLHCGRRASLRFQLDGDRVRARLEVERQAGRGEVGVLLGHGSGSSTKSSSRWITNRSLEVPTVAAHTLSE
jgi:hypothetical protein